MPTPIIQLEKVCKNFPTHRVRGGFKYTLLHLPEKLLLDRKPDVRPILRDVSLTVMPGESVGISGANGSGKSTLLGIIGGILHPDSGSVAIHGRIAMMLELGAGFCPDLSGRENIMVNGVMQGATCREIRERADEIIDFAGLNDFIDEPLFTYSSGMAARLGFSIMVHLAPDILLIDEALAVGDADFREKCLAKLRDLQQQGASLLLVSHNPADLAAFCSRHYLLRDGELQPHTITV